jgi:hypothetical protein
MTKPVGWVERFAKPIGSLRVRFDAMVSLALHPSYALRRTDLPVVSSPLAKNILLRAWVETAIEGLPSRTSSEGRFAIVTDVGRGMRWTQARA